MIAPYYHGHWLARTAARLARRYASRHDAQDIAQEAVCRYLGALRRGRLLVVQNHEAYLQRIVQRCVIDYKRAYRRNPMPVDLREEDTVLRAGVPVRPRCEHHDSKLQQTQQWLDVQALLPRLPAKERQVVRYLLSGQSLAPLARVDAVSPRSVDRRAQRAAHRLRHMLTGPT